MKFIRLDGVIIEGKIHALYSQQKGTECGIERYVKDKEIINVSNLEDITCEKCKKSILRTVNILRSFSEK
jgi:hypothetical protein